MQHRFALQIHRLHRIDHDAEIHLGVAHAVQHLLLRLIAQHDADLRVFAFAGGDALRHQMGGNGLAGRHPHRAAALYAKAARIQQRGLQFVQQPFDPVGQPQAGVGQHHFTRGAIQQANADLHLQLFHAVADRRLRQADRLAGAAEAAVAGDSDEHPQLFE